MDIFVTRPAKLIDLEPIQALATELAQSDIPFDSQIDINWAYSSDGIKYYSEKISNQLCTVAEHNNVIVGYSTYGIKEVPSWRLVKVAELENLYVTYTMRSKGVGQKQVNDFMSLAHAQEANKAAVSVFFPNDRAISFYKRQGLVSMT